MRNAKTTLVDLIGPCFILTRLKRVIACPLRPRVRVCWICCSHWLYYGSVINTMHACINAKLNGGMRELQMSNRLCGCILLFSLKDENSRFEWVLKLEDKDFLKDIIGDPAYYYWLWSSDYWLDSSSKSQVQNTDSPQTVNGNRKRRKYKFITLSI